MGILRLYRSRGGFGPAIQRIRYSYPSLQSEDSLRLFRHRQMGKVWAKTASCGNITPETSHCLIPYIHYFIFQLLICGLCM